MESRQEKFRVLFTTVENVYPLITSLQANLFSSEIEQFEKEFPRLHLKKGKPVIEKGQKLYSVVVSYKFI